MKPSGFVSRKLAGFVCAIGIAASIGLYLLADGRAVPVFATPRQAQVAPWIQTDKLEYLAGEPVTIFGEGFAPGERITLEVAHDGTPGRASGRLASFSARTDASGSFQSRWSIDRHDTGGLHFVIMAAGALGSRADTVFDRVGRLEAIPPLNLNSGIAQIRARGLNANELVTIRVRPGHGEMLTTQPSDESGGLVAQVDLPQDNPNAAIFMIVMTANQSGLRLILPLTAYMIAVPRPNGVPILNELRAEKGLAEAGWMETATAVDLFMTWKATGAWAKSGQTGNACALFDTDDHDGLIDLAVCGQIKNGNGDPDLVVQTATSPSVWTCDNRWRDRCGNPLPYGSPLQFAAGIQSGTLADLNRNASLITQDETAEGNPAHSTLRIRIDKSFLPRETVLTSVCAYPSPAGAESPLNCVAAADMPDNAQTLGGGGGASSSFTGPSLTGRVVYHSYASYSDGSSRLFVLDLGSRQLTNLSSGWTNLEDPMNAHWSPDGTKVVFMARPKKGKRASAWFDVFLYTIGQSGNPVNLTNTDSRHEEDPKFSPDGQRIVYKVRPSTLEEMDSGGRLLNTIVSSAGPERSMPYYSVDCSSVWFSLRPSGAANSASSIHRIQVNGLADTLVVDTPDVIDYYPIRDTIGQFLYSRTVSASNLFGQIYMYDGVQSAALPFNTPDADYSDAYPIDTRYILLSSTRAGGRGGYDLYVADRNTGTLWPLSGYNTGVNTSRQELGAAYTPN